MANHLAHAASPYLRQHADQPVDWYPWGQTALRKAKEEDKPIILSIGFATCHWCHVMARESFDDPDIAAFMNAHFVNIKVDREERPDLDQFYMAAGQILARNSGWPMNCFLTPEGKPFYAGTYFPPEPSGRQLSWLQALQYAQYNFRQNREGTEQQANRVLNTLQSREASFAPALTAPASDEKESLSDTLDQIHQGVVKKADLQHGGFRQAPKYPDFPLLRYLLQVGHFQKDQKSLDHFQFTIRQMADGGLYDQLGGGIARYTVDAAWRVPHFEKMLIDNVQWVEILAQACRIFPTNQAYRTLLLESLDFIENAFPLPTGGYGSALDAETEGVEGAFYTWTYEQLEAILEDQTPPVANFLGATREGNWESTNILFRPSGRAVPAKWDELRAKLLAARSLRTRPALDDKVVLASNAYLISAWLQAAPIVPQLNLLDRAQRLWTFIQDRFWEPQDQLLGHSLQNAQLQPHGFLVDYALFIQASIDLFEATAQTNYLETAASLMSRTLQLFQKNGEPLLYYTGIEQQETPLAQKDLHDLEVPSGNSVIHRNFWRLSLHLNRSDWMKQATSMLEVMQPELRSNPMAYGDWARHLLIYQWGYLEIGVLGPNAFDWLAKIQRAHFLPQAILIASSDGYPRHPLTDQRPVDQNRIFICQDYACQRPLSTLEELGPALELVNGQEGF
jgi:uncharacterized protein YyaL (SSP411 family)